MKFLIMTSPKDIAFTLPPAVVKQLSEETITWIKQKKQSGVVLETYSIAGWNRYAFICQLNSAEDIDRTLRAMPGTGLMNSETYPLSDYEETARANIEATKEAGKYVPSSE